MVTVLEAGLFSGADEAAAMWDEQAPSFWTGLRAFEEDERHLVRQWPLSPPTAARTAAVLNALMQPGREPGDTRDPRVREWALLMNRLPVGTAMAVQRLFAARGAGAWPRCAYLWSCTSQSDAESGWEAAFYRTRVETIVQWAVVASAIDHHDPAAAVRAAPPPPRRAMQP